VKVHISVGQLSAGRSVVGHLEICIVHVSRFVVDWVNKINGITVKIVIS
jgi:hypothetical protein